MNKGSIFFFALLLLSVICCKQKEETQPEPEESPYDTISYHFKATTASGVEINLDVSSDTLATQTGWTTVDGIHSIHGIIKKLDGITLGGISYGKNAINKPSPEESYNFITVGTGVFSDHSEEDFRVQYAEYRSLNYWQWTTWSPDYHDQLGSTIEIIYKSPISENREYYVVGTFNCTLYDLYGNAMVLNNGSFKLLFTVD